VSHDTQQLTGVACPECGGRLGWHKRGDAWDGFCKDCGRVTVQRPFVKGEGIERTRQAELAQPARPVPAQKFSTPVVGVTFVPGYPGNVRAAEAALVMAESFGDEHPSAVLIRRPDNENDPNAVEVHVPAVGGETCMIGHLPRALARRLAPSLDADEHWLAWVRSVRTHTEHENRPGIDIEVAKVVDDERQAARRAY
jgi:hypothetical protein